MKPVNDKIIDILNELLISEWTAIAQYKFHGEFNKNNGYENLADYFLERADDELKHSRKLIKRILFLEGMPNMTGMNEVKPAFDIENQLNNDLAAEYECIQKYDMAIHAVTCDMPDNTTRHILNNILDDENEHAKELENYLQQIKDVGGTKVFLSTKIKSE